MQDNQVKAIEQQIDLDYADCFPTSAGWEAAAAHLLLAYDFTVRAADTHTLDTLKYALMHTLRWGKRAASVPYRALPNDLDPPLFEKCRKVLRRGNEYTGICGAFISYHRGLVHVDQIGDQRIAFTGNADWKAYDVLDERLAFTQRTSSVSLVQDVRTFASELADELGSCQPSEMMHWFPDFGTARKLISPVNGLMRESFTLPPAWTCDGISLVQLRSFWRALMILGLIHCAVAYRLTGPRHTGFIQLLVKPRDALVDWIADCMGIEYGIVSQLIDLHSYDRGSKSPDIAVTPLLPIAPATLAASPWMLISSSFERNFRAHIALRHPTMQPDSSDILATSLAEDVVMTFTKAGFRATHSIPFKLDHDQGDIDLLVWSPEERYLLAVELKWIIETADFMEVLNRGESTCKDALDRQIPKYARMLSQDAGAFAAKAFKLDSKPQIDGWSCGIVMRGFVGSSRTVDNRYFVLNDAILKTRMLEGGSLRDICDWAHGRSYVPREGRDFRMSPVELLSPSGIQVKFWEVDAGDPKM